MAFSFNWAGLQAPQYPTYTDPVKAEDFQAMGKALRGYQNREAAKEYARKIDQFRAGRTAQSAADAKRIEEIKAEIARLTQENEQLKPLVQEETQEQPQEQVPVSTPVDMERELFLANFDPKTSSKEDIKRMQQNELGFTGNDVDGIWGPMSQNAYISKFGGF